jgi:hypothetical protein
MNRAQTDGRAKHEHQTEMVTHAVFLNQRNDARIPGRPETGVMIRWQGLVFRGRVRSA